MDEENLVALYFFVWLRDYSSVSCRGSDTSIKTNLPNWRRRCHVSGGMKHWSVNNFLPMRTPDMEIVPGYGVQLLFLYWILNAKIFKRTCPRWYRWDERRRDYQVLSTRIKVKKQDSEWNLKAGNAACEIDNLYSHLKLERQVFLPGGSS